MCVIAGTTGSNCFDYQHCYNNNFLCIIHLIESSHNYTTEHAHSLVSLETDIPTHHYTAEHILTCLIPLTGMEGLGWLLHG